MDCSTCASKKTIETLNIAKGQIEGIIKMINDQRYCIDVSKQILSVGGLLKKANMIVLKQHLETCVKEAMLKGNGDEKIEEIMLILEKYMDK